MLRTYGNMEVNKIPDPSTGPHVFSASNQRNSREGSMRQGRKMEKRGEKKAAERNTGYNFPCMINFQSKVLLWFSLKPVFPLAPGQRLLTLFLFTRQALARDLSGNGYTSLEKDYFLKKPWREKSPNQVQLFFMQSSMCLQQESSLSADLQHKECMIHWGRIRVHSASILLTTSCSITELQVDPEWSCQSVLPPPSDITNPATCTEKVRGRDHQDFSSNNLSE